jgi:hypothetical protein
MADAKLQAELEQSKAQIFRLRERMSVGLPTIHKDLSLIFLIPKWSGSESAVPLEEFLASVDSAAMIGNWDQTDCLGIAALKLVDPAKSFHMFRHRFRDVHTDQYHFMRLQTARQAKNEGLHEFAVFGWFSGCSSSSGSIPEPSDSATCFIHCAFSQRGGKAGTI